MRKRSRMPRDVSKLSKAIIDLATGQAEPDPDQDKDPAAVALGRKGGLKGGKARAQKLSAEELSEAGKRAARARWAKEGRD